MKYAGFFKRIFSLIYDSFLILGVILFLTLILVFYQYNTLFEGEATFLYKSGFLTKDIRPIFGLV